jgi:c-di-GMP-binding flagellar brake protein YcgR
MHNDVSSAQRDQRQGRRKIIKVRALFKIEGSANTVLARTLDLSAVGVSVSVPDAVAPGAHAMVRFDMLHEGKPTPVNARTRVQYCILSSGEYKVGLQFINLEPSAMAAVSRFLQ